MTSLVLLGASGSIGSQTLSILKNRKDDFSLLGFSVGKRTRCISYILKAHKSVKAICIKDKNKISYYQKKYPQIQFYFGDDGLIDLIKEYKPQMVVNALVGFVGVKPSLYSLENNYKLALANKESLVVAGELINKILNSGKGKLYPIDSEHSALWKCLKVDSNEVDKLIITASGGAFRKLTREELKNVTPEDALCHPTWKMGNKITIDCATMVNKSFEIIEAYYLFGYKYKDIEVLLHDESHIHSMVKYKDGTYRADISFPSMLRAIEFALYEGNIPFKTYINSNYHNFGNYHFHKFSDLRYPMVKYADYVISKGGSYGVVYNAANEEAVYAFLNHKIPFLAIESIINKMMNSYVNKNVCCYEDIKKIDILTRKQVNELIMKGEY